MINLINNKRIRTLFPSILFALTISMLLFACSDINKPLSEVDHYMLNKRSLKIHAMDCDSISLMSNKNKLEVDDSLNNLLNEGYIPCEKCKARRRKKFLGFIDNPFREKNYIIDIEDLPTRDEYLNAIYDVGEWYINHVPTYQGRLSTEKLNDYNGNNDYYKKYLLKSQQPLIKHIWPIESEFTYNVISSNSENLPLTALNNNDDILMAKEDAAINYKLNYDGITKTDSQSYYPCKYIVNSKDSYKKAGDDCVRFFFTCMNHMDTNFTYRLCKITNKNWSGINTDYINNENGIFTKAMQMNNFEVYETSVHKNNISNIKTINKDFKLQQGDIIIRKGHLHIYLGNGEKQADNFGWGKVNRIFPQNYKYNLEGNESTGYYITCDHDYDKNTKLKRHYTKIFRYKGGLSVN